MFTIKDLSSQLDMHEGNFEELKTELKQVSILNYKRFYVRLGLNFGIFHIDKAKANRT